jgi:nucleoside-diphosphate-sugar epimerase
MPVRPLAPADLDHVLRLTKSIWDEVRGRSLFVTGGTGFFGMWLTETFLHINDALGLNSRMTILSRDPAQFAAKAPHLAANKALTLLKGDVRDFKFPSGEYSFVIHAGTTSSMPVPPLEMFSTIVEGTRHTLAFALHANAKKFLYVSSGAVYGKQPPELTHIPEDFAGAPDVSMPSSAYGEGKRAGELLCAMMSEGTELDCKIARCFAFVGPHLPLNAHFAVGNFINDGLKGGPIHIAGDGSTFRSYLYAADLAVWLWTIMIQGGHCRPYNVGSAIPMTIEETARYVALEAKHLVNDVRIIAARARNPDQPSLRYVPCTARAKSELALGQTVGISEAIGRSLLWHELPTHL